jgi:hypothetical protein
MNILNPFVESHRRVVTAVSNVAFVLVEVASTERLGMIKKIATTAEGTQGERTLLLKFF